MQLTATLHKRHEKGGATFLLPGTRARVIISRKAFADSGAPESITLESDAFREANEKEKARAERLAKKAAETSPEALAERIAKTQRKLERLQKMAESNASQGSSSAPLPGTGGNVEQPFAQASA